jgi:hypothetical protein
LIIGHRKSRKNDCYVLCLLRFALVIEWVQFFIQVFGFNLIELSADKSSEKQGHTFEQNCLQEESKGV